MSDYKMPIKKDLECVPEHDCQCVYPPHPPYYPHDSRVVMNCGTGGGVVLPVNNGGVLVNSNGTNNYYLPTSIVLATVNLDTRKMKKPTIKIDFSSLISLRIQSTCYNFSDYFFRLTFRLSRSCVNGPQIPLGTWTYELSNNLQTPLSIPENTSQTTKITESFGFTWCECQECPACCTYIVEITDFQYYNVECASITNVGINAMAVSC